MIFEKVALTNRSDGGDHKRLPFLIHQLEVSRER